MNPVQNDLKSIPFAPSQHLANQSNNNKDLPLQLNSNKVKNRPNKIAFTSANQATLRMAKSGSVKEKLNLQNTKLKINIDNLSSNLHLHQENQKWLMGQLNKYKEKILKYKDKNRQKDVIISKLMNKLQKLTAGFNTSGNVKNMNNNRNRQKNPAELTRECQQYLKQYKQKSANAQNIDINVRQLVNNYQKLLSQLSLTEKRRVLLQIQNQQYRETVQNLTGQLNRILQSNQNKYGHVNQSNSVRKIDSIDELKIELEKEKEARKNLHLEIQKLRMEVDPGLIDTFKESSRNKNIRNQQYGTTNNKQSLDYMHSTLSKQLQKCHSYFQNTQASITNNLRSINSLQQQISTLKSLQTVLQNQANQYIVESKKLQHTSKQLETARKQINRQVQQRMKDGRQADNAQKRLNNKIDELLSVNRNLHDKLDFEMRKRKKFQLKLLSYAQEDGIVIQGENKDKENTQIEDKQAEDVSLVDQKFLQQHVQIIKKQSISNKKQVQSARILLEKQKQIYLVLQSQYNILQQQNFQLRNLLQKNSIDAQKYIKISMKEKQSNLNSLRQSMRYDILNTLNDQKKIEYLQNQNVQLKIQNQRLKKIVQNLENAALNNRKERLSLRSDKSHKKSKASSQIFQSAEEIQESINHNLQHEMQVLERISSQKKLEGEKSEKAYQELIQQYRSLMEKYRDALLISSTIKIQDNNGQEQYDITSQQRRNKNNQRQEDEGSIHEHDRSQQMIQDSYQNINDEIDRLSIKCQKLSKQNQQLKNKFISEINKSDKQVVNLNMKIQNSQKINSDLSRLVAHLQSQLSKFRSLNPDRSGSSSQIKGRSPRKDSTQRLQDKFQQLRRLTIEHENLIQSLNNSQQSNTIAQQKQQKIKELQSQIKSVKQTLHMVSSVGQQLHESSSGASFDRNCIHCVHLLKNNADLIIKLKNLKEQNQERQNNLINTIKELQRQIIELEKQHQGQQNPKVLKEKFIQMKKKILVLEASTLQVTAKALKQEQEVEKMKQTVAMLMNQVQKKQYENIRLRSQALKKQSSDKLQNQGQSIEQQKIGYLFNDFEQKLKSLESQLQQKQAISIKNQDMYETINYLNEQCEMLKSQNQLLKNNNTHLSPQNLQETQHALLLQQNQRLKHELKHYVAKIKNMEELYSTINLSNNKGENNRFWEIVKQKQQKIDELTLQMIKVNLENGSLKRQTEKLQKLAQQLKSLQSQIQNMATPHESTQNCQNDNEKFQQTTKVETKTNRTLSHQVISPSEENVDNKQLKTIRQQRNLSQNQKYQLICEYCQKLQKQINQIANKYQILDRRCTQYEKQQQIFNKTSSTYSNLLNVISTLTEQYDKQSIKKTKPNLYITERYKQLEPLLKVIQQWLYNIWGMVEERTRQYNELRDQMNIISMQCMRSANIQDIGNREGVEMEINNKIKQSQVIEQRYEQVLAQLIQYENLNKKLEWEISNLKEQVKNYKREIQQIHMKCMIDIKSQSSSQGIYNQDRLKKLLMSSQSIENVQPTSINMRQFPQIIKLLLMHIVELQKKLDEVQDQLEQKNKRFDSLIQRQLSFRSQKSDRDRSRDKVKTQKSILSDRENSRNIENEQGNSNIDNRKQNSKGNNREAPDADKSLSLLNSARIFREIQQLTKANEQIREKEQKHKHSLTIISKQLQNIINSQSNKGNRDVLQRVSQEIKQIIAEDDAQRDNSGFDLGQDFIMSSSFAERMKISQNRKMIFADVKGTLQEQSKNILLGKNNAVEYEKSMTFMHQNYMLIDQLIQKVKSNYKNQTQKHLETDEIRRIMANGFTDKQIQQIIYQDEQQIAINKILAKVIEAFNFTQRKQSQDISEIERNRQNWVEGKDIEDLINKIYPKKTELCAIVSNSIEMLLGAETSNGILKAIEYLFMALSKKQMEQQQNIKRKDDVMAQYAQKMNKVLMARPPEQDHDAELVQETSFRKTGEIRSEYEIRKESQSEDQDKQNMYE